MSVKPLDSSGKFLESGARVVRIMAWNPSTSRYELVEGYEGQKDFTYDSNGNLTEIRLTVILYDGRTRTVRRTLTYDANGNLTSVSRWEVVS